MLKRLLLLTAFLLTIGGSGFAAPPAPDPEPDRTSRSAWRKYQRQHRYRVVPPRSRFGLERRPSAPRFRFDAPRYRRHRADRI